MPLAADPPANDLWPPVWKAVVESGSNGVCSNFAEHAARGVAMVLREAWGNLAAEGVA